MVSSKHPRNDTYVSGKQILAAHITTCNRTIRTKMASGKQILAAHITTCNRTIRTTMASGKQILAAHITNYNRTIRTTMAPPGASLVQLLKMGQTKGVEIHRRSPCQAFQRGHQVSR
ncbi:hypothetical protein ACOMHN_024928 [Nucella lapillus]